MAESTLTYFPVNNGDTSLIKLSDSSTIIIDINLTQDSLGDEEGCYDVRAHLLQELKKDVDGRLHTDVFILTHPDQDHVRGFSDVFFTGEPEKYSKNDKENGKIIIDELWFAPRIFWEGRDLCDAAKEFKKEALRRIDLYRANTTKANLAGNRMRVIGYTDNPDLKGLEAITTRPGQAINLINGQLKSDFGFFVHGPLKENTDHDEEDRNRSSIVLQAVFAVGNQAQAGLALFSGDSDCSVWEEMIRQSVLHNNEETLFWDLFMAPHHCSWTFFSEQLSEEETPSEDILNFLSGYKRKGAYVIASSKAILDDDDNPPHFIAAEKYKEIVGDNFLCTADHSGDNNSGLIHFRITENGPQRVSFAKESQIVSSAAIGQTINQPKTYG